jgi:hypothetical protein
MALSALNQKDTIERRCTARKEKSHLVFIRLPAHYPCDPVWVYNPSIGPRCGIIPYDRMAAEVVKMRLSRRRGGDWLTRSPLRTGDPHSGRSGRGRSHSPTVVFD